MERGVRIAFAVSASQTGSLIPAALQWSLPKENGFCHAECFKSRIAAHKGLDLAHS